MRRILPLALVLVAASSPSLRGQSPVSHIRDLYSNAAYEDVLSAVAEDPTGSPDVGQYKVFSLVALGRVNDAERAAEAVLRAHLDFHADQDASPRLVDLFTSVRRRIAPEMMKAMFVDAKAMLERKEFDAAVKSFSQLTALTEDRDLKDEQTIAELRFLAAGFLDLARASAAPAAAGHTAAPSSGQVAAADAGAAPAGAGTGKAAVPVLITQPSVIQETWPRWNPPDSVARVQFRGRILVHIDSQGNVSAAEVVAPVHPLYDEALLQASKSWKYKPGLRNGTPVASERLVEVVLKPRLDDLQ